ncbi:MAG: transposase [bacterium]|nr:transposase [bacterium]
MLRLADVVARHGSAYIARHRGAMLPSHVRALSAITRCRTPALGGHLAECGQCGCEHLLFHSCRHRACPRCGQDTTERWLARQRQLLLPGPYFHVVFTLPAELRRLVRSHQRVLIGVLFRAAYSALAELCRDERYLGGRIGALAVLHTWTRTLGYHPHIHMLVPGGALAVDGTWRPAPRRRKRYLVPVKALGMLFAGKFLDAAGRALPETATIPDVAVGTKWVVFAKPAVQGRLAVLRYLGRYIHKTAIVDGAIERCTDETVTFRYRDSTTHVRKRMTLSPHEFLRRFLQHTLPKGLHRVRAFGLLSTTARTTLRLLQLLLGAAADPADLEDHQAPAKPRHRCPHCKKGSLLLTRRLDPDACRAWQAALAKAARAPPTTTHTGALAS